MTDAEVSTQGWRNAVNAVDQTSFRTRLKPFYDTMAGEFGATQWGLLQNSIAAKLG